MPNEVFYQGEGYYLSYLDLPKYMSQFTDVADDEVFKGFWNSETALCITEPEWQCLILYGDHREAYKSIAHSLEACKKYFLEHSEEIGSMSDSLNVADNDNQKVEEVVAA